MLGWVRAIYMGDLKEASVSWLQLGPTLHIVAILRVNEKREDLHLHLSL